MKKTLFLSAILATALCSSAFGAVTYVDAYTYAPAGNADLAVHSDTMGKVTLAITSSGRDVVPTLKEADATALLNDSGSRFKVTDAAALENAGTLIIANGKYNKTDTSADLPNNVAAGQLWLDGGSSTSGITVTNALILGNSSYRESGTAHDWAAVRMHDSSETKKVELAGAITLAADAKISFNQKHSVVSGAITAASNQQLSFAGADQTDVLTLKSTASVGKLLTHSGTLNVEGAITFTGSQTFRLQLDGSSRMNLLGQTTYSASGTTAGVAVGENAALTIGNGATLETNRFYYSSTDASNGSVTVAEGGTVNVSGSTAYSVLSALTVNGNVTTSSAVLKVNNLTVGSTGDATIKSITLFEKNSTAGSITVNGTLSLTDKISTLTAAGTGKVNVNSNTMTFTGAGDTAFAGSLNVVADSSTGHGNKVTLNNFSGTVELTGRFTTESNGCNFGNATKIVLHGDRDNGNATLESNNTTGFWGNTGATTFSQLIEVKGEHWVDIFASGTYTFNGAVSGDMLRTLKGKAVTFNAAVTLDKFTDLDNAVSFNGDTSIGTLDIASGKTVTFAATTVNTLTTLSGAGNVVNNGTIDVVAEDHEAIVVRDTNGYNDVYRTLTLGGTGTLSGTGTWTLNGAAATLDGHALSTAAVQDTTEYHIDKADATYDASLKAKYVIAEGKKLTASGNTNAIQVKENNGTLVLNNVTGYFVSGKHAMGNVEIEGTLTLDNGYSFIQYQKEANVATIANLSGTGTISTTSRNISERTVITGDVASTLSFSNSRASGSPTFAFTKDVEKVTLKSISNTGSGTLSFEANALEVQSLTLSAGAVGVYAIDSYIRELDNQGGHNEADEVSLTTTTLTVSGNSKLNANLVIAANGKMDFTSGHVLTMGSSVTIGEGVQVYITGSAEDIRYGQEVTIMNSVEEAITLTNALIFVNGVQQNDFYLKHTDDNRIVVAPEPATATLSLLALAGLCARRRRH